MSLALITLFAPTLIGRETEINVRWVMYGTSATVALIALYEAFGVGRIMFPATSFLADPLFTPTGTTIASVCLFAVILPLAVADASEAARQKRETALAFLIIIALIEAVGLGVTLWQIIPKITANFLPIGAAWSMTLESMKSTKQALVGTGAENFLVAFTAGRPVYLNLTPVWNARFVLSGNLLFHLLTIYGLTGGVAVILLLKGLFTNTKSLFTVSLIVCAVTFLLIPPNITVLIATALLVVLVPRQKTVTVQSPFTNRLWLGMPATVLLAAAAVFSVFCLGRVYWADMLITKSMSFARQNNGTQTYNLQVKAIGIVPQVSDYHILLSQTTMSMAVSLANSLRGEQSANKNIQNDTQLVTQLIQQSIRDAKLAISVNPKNILAWENMARLYSQLVGVANGADNWSTTAYNQAIDMDPTNATLRLEFGALFVRLTDYTQAITLFQQAVSLKSNYTNAYYNLSNAYKLNKDITQAVTAMEKTVALVDKNSDDYRIATQALADLKKNAPGLHTTPTDEQQPSDNVPLLTTPAPPMQITPTINVPDMQLR